MNILRTAVLGAASGAIGGIVQPAVGKLEDLLFFPPDEDTNVPRHFVEALEDEAGMDAPFAVNQAMGTAFHIGYALFWGAVYAAARERWRMRSVPGGLGLGALLYGMAFSRVGAGVMTGAEPPPDQRPRREWLLHTTMPLSYGLTTALVYEKVRSI